MADYNISAQITADTKGFESGVKKAQSASKKLGKSITDVVKGFGKSGLSGAITSAGLALGGIGLAVGTAVKAIKGITKALGECAEAYKVQLQAERALDTAISNSPFVSGSASKALKDYASQLQKVSNLGDEEIIPQMTQLIATGRTEAEVMKIIATASDMSASGAMSFDQAVTQLNATLNGNIGRLGQQNAELKGLTEEELKSGRAVDILAEKYKGLASATIDTKKQLQNAIGDLKETFGSVFEKAMAPMRKFFTDLIQGWADARKAKQEYENSMIAIEKGEATANDYRVKEKKLLEEIEAIEGDLRKQAEELGMTYEEAYNLMADWQRAQLEAMKEELDNTRLLAKMHDGLEKIKQKEAEWAQEEADRRQTEIDKETKIADLKTEYLQKIAEQEAKWKHIKDITGEQISNEEKIAFYQDSLVDLMTKAGGQITTNNQLYKDQMAIIQKLQEGLNPKETSTEWEKKLFQQTIERLEEEKQAMLESKAFTEMSTEEKFRIEKAYNDKLYELNLQRIQQERENALKSVEDYANAEEEKKRIMEYYQNLIKDNAKKYSTSMVKAGEEASKGFAKGFKNVLNEVSNIMQRIGKVIGKMFSGAKGGLGKLFDLNPDTALEGLLKLEDKILTFFMETLPKIPQFIASALQSISVMLSTIKLNIDKKQIKAMIKNIMATVKMFVPDILKIGLEIAREIVEGLAEGIKENAGLIGQVLNDMAQILAQYMPPVVLAIIDAVSKFISAIPDSAIMSLVNGAIDLVIKLASALINNAVAIAEKLIPALFEIILQLFKKLPEILKTVLWEVIKGLGKVASFIWEGVKKLFGFETGTNNAPKGLALVGEAGPELVNFKGGERILNARNTQRALEGATSGNAGNTFNVTFNNLQDTSAYAMMSQLRQYNRQLSINGVI
jgi:hypothetical protein